MLRRWILWLCGCWLFPNCIGCALIGEVESVPGGMRNPFADKQLSESDGANPLPSIPIRPNAIQLEVMLIERPLSDPLIGSQLWNEVAPVGSLSPEKRAALEKHGFRAGHVSSNPPRALQALLEMATGDDASRSIDDRQKLVGRRLTFPSGTRTEVPTTSVYPECALAVPTLDGERVETFENARFVIGVKTVRLRDGWARLEFSPEIHHGEFRWRPVAKLGRFEGQTSQEIVPLFEQQFSVDLAEGEMAILTAENAQQGTLGRYFFFGSERDAPLQRLLVVRLVDMAKTDPLYAK